MPPRLLALLLLAACAEESRPRTSSGGNGPRDAGASTDAGGGPRGAETLGHMCFGACGSADARKCAIASADCASDLCLVDPGHAQITYCTIDCTAEPCPSGWRCEDIKAFGHDEVQRGCVAEPAMCGDGVVQLGELCDGDSAMGRCVECKRWEAVCGDGVVQAPEVCDGDRDGAYCLDRCTRLARPHAKLTVRKRVANAVDRVEGNTTYYYGTGYQAFDVTEGDLPIAGDANGCGALRVAETNAELTRLEWTVCGDTGASSVWSFALPRARVQYRDWEGAIPPAFAAGVTLRHPDGVRSLAWTMDHMEAFDVRTYLVAAPASTTGDISFRLEQADPIQSFSTARAELDLEVQMLHPAL